VLLDNLNAITDVAGVRVGHVTLIEGDDVGCFSMSD
jgi:L-aminopeptidase/D-esterase-like protein